ncbi:MAG: PAS domain S-box protein [Nitrospirae bacterium]|nr:PAS domain S-box protein [Nitrospirota bacterium]
MVHEMTIRSKQKNMLLHSEMLMNMPEGVILIKADDDSIIYTNPSFNRMFGYESGELQGKHISIVNAPTDVSPEDMAEQIQSQIKQSGTWRGEILHVRKDGTQFWCEAVVSAFSHNTVWISIHTDITERKQLLSDLSLHSEIMRNMSEGVVLVSILTGSIVYCNPKFEQIFGYSDGELLGKDIVIVHAPTEKTPEEEADQIRESLKKYKSWQGEFYAIKKNGTCFWSYVTLSTFSHAKYGNVWLGVHTDVTESKRAEERFRGFFDFSKGLLGIASLDGYFILTNPSMCHTLGYTDEELKSKPFYEFAHPDDLGKTITVYEKVIHGATVIDFEHRFRCKNGTYRNIVWTVVPNLRENIVYTTAYDITELKKTGRKLRESNISLNETIEKMGTLYKQQEFISMLGIRALKGAELQTLMDRAALEVSEALDVGYSRVLQLLPDSDKLLMVAGVGWKEGLVGTSTVSRDINSQSWFLLRSNEPLIITDLPSETRFDIQPLLLEHGIISSICVLIYYHNKPWGILGAFCDKHRDFTENDIHFCQSVANILSYAITRKEEEQIIRRNLDEKSILLKEIHHRVKNNLQIISAMVMMQSEQISDKAARDAFEDTVNRIKAMALVHEEIYGTDVLSQIDFHDYTEHLIAGFMTFHNNGFKLHYKINIDNVHLAIDTALPCALILNELLSNAFKYAFIGKTEGEIVVSLFKEDDSFILEVKDNGAGFPADFDTRQTKSLGMVIIRSLTKQILGTVKFKNEGGACSRVKFKGK